MPSILPPLLPQPIEPQNKKIGMLEYGQVPLVELDGLNLVQSSANIRYIARKFGFYPGNKDIKDAYLGKEKTRVRFFAKADKSKTQQNINAQSTTS